MNVIIWNDRPSPFDTFGVERIWFEKSTVCYTIATDGSNGRNVYHAKMKEIDVILSDEAYAKAGRNRG